MEWRDEGVIVAVRRHGETSAIIEVLTSGHGRHLGVVRGGASRRLTPVLQPGNQVALDWRARLEEHLGSYRVELLTSRSAILADRRALAALGSVCALVSFAFPERMHLPVLYEKTVGLIDRLVGSQGWTRAYVLWEVLVLQDLGYGLDLRSCAATGTAEDLAYVSPKTGRAVSRTGGAGWADKLLPLPGFFCDDRADAPPGDILDGLKTTGHFLERWLAPALGNRPLPGARARLVVALQKAWRKEQER